MTYQENKKFQLVLQLSKAVTKFLLALGLQDPSAAVDATSDVLKMLPSQQRGGLNSSLDESTISSATEIEFSLLLPIFLREGNSVAAGEQRSIVLEIIEALRTARLSLAKISELGFNANEVAKHVNERHPMPKRDFSESGVVLYEQLLAAVCQHTIIVTSQFPEFQSTAIRQILSTENKHYEELSALLRLIMRTVDRAASYLPPDEKVAAVVRFELNYRSSVARSFDQIEMFGIKDQTLSRRYPLTVSYVSLSMDVQRKPTGRPRKQFGDRIVSPEDQRAELNSVEDILASSKRLLIQGPPGSGKSTLLQWIAVRSAERSFSDHLPNWNRTVPFLVRVREYSTRDLPTPSDLAKLMAPTIVDLAPESWAVNRFLENQKDYNEERKEKPTAPRSADSQIKKDDKKEEIKGPTAILLVDGLDEISRNRRGEVIAWLERYILDFPNAYFVVASRDYAVSHEWAERFGFLSTVLEPMTLPQMHLFVDNWHQAISKTLIGDNEVESTLALAPLVRRELQRNVDLRKLAVNPLLCALLCALYRTNNSLPQRRLKIYESASEMLLETLDQVKGVDLEGYPDLETEQKRRIVEDLAFWMMMNNEPVISIERAQLHIGEKIRHMRNLDSNASPESVMKLLTERSGLLRNPSIDTLDFSHRTFQEYFSGVHAVRQGSSGFLLEKSSDDAWRNVIIYAVGLMDIPQRKLLLTDLLRRGNSRPEWRRPLHLLAVAALETCVEMDPELEEEILQKARNLLPPRSQGDVVALAQAGTVLVPLLRRTATSEKAWSIATLAEIGGERAVEALVEYASSPDIENGDVANALVRAWLSLEEAGDLGRYVIPRLNDHQHRAILDEASTLQGFEHLKLLRVVYIRNSTMISDLSPLADLTKLEEIVLINCKNVRDLSPLARLRGLKGLHLEGFNLVNDISPLAQMQEVGTLLLRGFSNVTDLSPLSQMTSLISLDLRGFSRHADLAPISHLRELRRLQIDGFAGETDRIDWGRLTNLHTVHGLERAISR